MDTMKQRTETLKGRDRRSSRAGDVEEVPALVVGASNEPRRVGEVVLLSSEGRLTFGRHDGGQGRAQLSRQRPGFTERCASLASPYISHAQLEISSHGHELVIENVGKCPLYDGD